MKKEQILEKGIVKEMKKGADDFKIEVPISDDIDIAELTEGDKDPLFVTVEALNPQVSKNHRVWTEEMMLNVADQIIAKKPDAYQGHLKDEDRATSTPTAKTIWLGAVVKHIAGKPRLFIKGYVMPYAKELKQYLKAAKASGKRVAVSVYGQAEQIWDNVKKTYDIQKFDLESIDWARPGSEGVVGSGYLSVASEMKGEVMDREEVIKSVTLSEMESLNPSVLESVRKQEAEKLATTIKEMEDKVAKVEETIKLYGEIKPDVVAEMSKSYDGLMDKYISDKVSEKIKSKSVQSIAIRQIVSEMKDTFKSKELVDQTIEKIVGSDEITSIIREMEATKQVINPGKDNRVESGRKYTKI